jgi:hypothetical protein
VDLAELRPGTGSARKGSASEFGVDHRQGRTLSGAAYLGTENIIVRNKGKLWKRSVKKKIMAFTQKTSHYPLPKT